MVASARIGCLSRPWRHQAHSVTEEFHVQREVRSACQRGAEQVKQGKLGKLARFEMLFGVGAASTDSKPCLVPASDEMTGRTGG